MTTLGRFVTAFTILIGISATSFLSGTLASVFVERNTRARRGLMDFKKLKNHVIVCGWKDNMKDILLDIINLSDGIASEDIVIISNVEPDKVESLKESSELQSLRFVRGDYFSDATLKRAAVESAKKVLVLADSLESHAPSEVDSKTVMTVLAVKAMARDSYTVAVPKSEYNVFFGKLALIDADPRSATVIARENSVFLVISKDDFLDLGKKHPEYALPIIRTIAKSLAARLRKTTTDMLTIFDALVEEVKS